MLVAAAPALVGTVVGGLIAIALSGLFPTGFARALEPHPGISIDFVALTITASLRPEGRNGRKLPLGARAGRPAAPTPT